MAILEKSRESGDISRLTILLLKLPNTMSIEKMLN